jgi:acyl carrier protein
MINTSLNDASSQNLKYRVLSVIADVTGLKQDKLHLDMSLMDDLVADSVDRVTLFMALEDEFGQSIPEDEIGPIKSIEDLVNFIGHRLKRNPDV